MIDEEFASLQFDGLHSYIYGLHSYI